VSDIEKESGYYESKGMVRQMVVLTEAHKDRLKEFSKLHKITIGEVIEVLLDDMEPATAILRMEARRANKVDGRAGKRPEKLSKTRLIRNMKDLTPEQLAAIEAIVEKKS
jgi:hypothetical protein